MIQDALALLVERRDLSREQAAKMMRLLMAGDATPAQSAAFLVALRMKGETVDEITGLAETMRAVATPVVTVRRPLVDTCGTGGDRSGTFNVSTAAAFVVAGAGTAVAKHGNRSATSKCGSADVLEALGVNIEASPETVGRCIDEIGIGFLFARTFHKAMKNVAGIRQELRVRTVFNILGPLTNPARACGQVMGVFDAALIEPLAQVLRNLGVRRAFVVAGCDGLDEITLGGPSKIAEVNRGEINLYEMTPEEVGMNRVPYKAVLGGDAATNARLLTEVLQGRHGPHRDIVALNAAAGILAGRDGDTDWKGAVQEAQHVIDSGAAYAKLAALVERTHAAG